MLRIIWRPGEPYFVNLVDKDHTFEPGQIRQLIVSGDQIICNVSDSIDNIEENHVEVDPSRK